MEAALLIWKWVVYVFGGLISAGILALIGWNYQKTLDTYTKSEIDRMIKEAYEAHSKQTDKLITSMDKLTSNIEKLNIQMAIVEVKLEK